MSKSSLKDRLAPKVRRSLVKLGHDISIARRKRRLTAATMAERLGVSMPTYLRIERGDLTVSIGAYAAALYTLGLGTPFAEIVDAGTDDQALLLEAERLPKRVRMKKEPRPL